MSMTLGSKKKNWLLYQCRAAAFYQAEYWSALWEMERMVGGYPEGSEWDVVERIFQLESTFSGRDLYPSDLTLFLSGLHLLGRKDKRFEGVLLDETQAELLTQLRKAYWTNAELRRIAKVIARAIGERNPESIWSQFSELAMASHPDAGYLVTMQDVGCFILRNRLYRFDGGRRGLDPVPES